MNHRGIERLDYKILHETGRKVKCGGENSTQKMNIEREITEKIKIREDIKHSLNLYTLDDLITDEGISKGMKVMSELGKNFRHIDIELKNKMDEHDYAARYQKYETIIGEMMDFINRQS